MTEYRTPMVEVSFKDWKGVTKNPTTNGSQITVEREVSRVVVSVGSHLKPAQIKRFVEIMKTNAEIGQQIINKVSLAIKSGLGFDQFMATQREIARSQNPQRGIEQAVKEILASKKALV